MFPAHRDVAGYPDSNWNLDPIEKFVLRSWFTGGHQEVKGEVGNKREGMGWIDPLGGQQWVDFPLEIGVHFFFLSSRQVFIPAETDILLG